MAGKFIFTFTIKWKGYSEQTLLVFLNVIPCL